MTNAPIYSTGDVFAPKEEESTSSDPTYVEDTMYMYFPDRLPAQRQLSYQLCDIMDDELQKIIHSNDGKERECTVSLCCLCTIIDGLQKCMKLGFCMES